MGHPEDQVAGDVVDLTADHVADLVVGWVEHPTWDLLGQLVDQWPNQMEEPFEDPLENQLEGQTIQGQVQASADHQASLMEAVLEAEGLVTWEVGMTDH